MSYESIRNPPKILYHYTKKDNVESILSDGSIKKFKDQESWFCGSIEDTLRYMELTIMNEGHPYIDVNGMRKRYPHFVAKDFVILGLTPRYQKDGWVKWNQEYPLNTPIEKQILCKEFSNLKIGFRGDFKFKENPMIFEMTDFLQEIEQEQDMEQIQELTIKM